VRRDRERRETWNRFRLRSLRIRLLLWFASLIALAVVLVGFALSVSAARSFRDQYAATYRSNGRAIVALVDNQLQRTVQGNTVYLEPSSLSERTCFPEG